MVNLEIRRILLMTKIKESGQDGQRAAAQGGQGVVNGASATINIGKSHESTFQITPKTCIDLTKVDDSVTNSNGGARKKNTFCETMPVLNQNNVGVITKGMLDNAIEQVQSDSEFQYQRHQRIKMKVMGKKGENSGVKGAPQTKTLAVTNFTTDTKDEDVETLVKDVGNILNFRKAYNLEKMKTKQFTFQVLLNVVDTFLDGDKWPLGVCCRFWETKVKRVSLQ